MNPQHWKNVQISNRKPGDIVPATAISERAEIVDLYISEGVSLELMTFYKSSRRNAKGRITPRGKVFTETWDAIVHGGSQDGRGVEFHFFVPVGNIG